MMWGAELLRMLKRLWVAAVVVGFLIHSLSVRAHALSLSDSKSKKLQPLQSDWDSIALRVDLRNLMGPSRIGFMSRSEMLAQLQGVNEIWHQCSIRFVPREVENVETAKLGIPYVPGSEADLSRIAEALNPRGFEALPITIAGPWNFANQTGYFLNGLGWVFTGSQGVVRIGAMVSSNILKRENSPVFFAHEIGHALSLSEGGNRPDIMGVGNNLISMDQCVQARSFAKASLSIFLL